MALNCLFFVHESMHRKYTIGEDFTFVQKIPQLVFTIIVSNIMEVVLCFLSITDVHYYEIKQFSNYKDNFKKVTNIFECIKRKLVTFFIFTFLLFLFYWYLISAFCAVYINTQKIFLKDSAMSFLISLIEPFIIYGLSTILRFISLAKCCKKNSFCQFIYKLSSIIPLF